VGAHCEHSCPRDDIERGQLVRLELPEYKDGSVKLLGAAAVQTLQAQAKPPVYMIAINEITN